MNHLIIVISSGREKLDLRRVLLFWHLFDTIFRETEVIYKMCDILYQTLGTYHLIPFCQQPMHEVMLPHFSQEEPGACQSKGTSSC